MTLKTFLLGMLVSFGLAWMCMIAIPVAKMGALPPVKMSSEEDAAYYQHQTSGRILNGAEIYASNGCYTCHSQLIRPTYLGSEIFRKDFAGVSNADGDSRRETHYDDYNGERYAQLGLTRMGPDLSNFGHRADAYAAKTGMTAEQWVIAHLHNPRNSALQLGEQGEKIDMTWSNCPAQLQMFAKKDLNGQGDSLALEVDPATMSQVVPCEEARVLASYLLSLRRDSKLPASMDRSPRAAEADSAAK
ncbi:MAG: cbb3-type cytochrome c oxidase subunit II [Akkermansiaceae bacterium]|nr:cbb3-type cytochrome c oxidase subunit II [Akkermansiaceae bacterium]